MLHGHVHAFFGEMSIRSLAHFSYWVVCFFDIELQGLLACFGDEFLISIFICKYFFFPFEHSLLLSFMDSLAVQMLLMLIRLHLFIFVLFFILVRGGSKKSLLRFMKKHVHGIFS